MDEIETGEVEVPENGDWKRVLVLMVLDCRKAVTRADGPRARDAGTRGDGPRGARRAALLRENGVSLTIMGGIENAGGLDGWGMKDIRGNRQDGEDRSEMNDIEIE